MTDSKDPLVIRESLKCPHCGGLYPFNPGMVPTHDWPRPLRQVCPGSGQSPRKQGDKRLLGKDTARVTRNDEQVDALTGKRITND